jgi:hypothetical protein
MLSRALRRDFGGDDGGDDTLLLNTAEAPSRQASGSKLEVGGNRGSLFGAVL